jgi:hypothetical protein
MTCLILLILYLPTVPGSSMTSAGGHTRFQVFETGPGRSPPIIVAATSGTPGR